ncbi:hypothetical protein Tco_1222745 [Tanacetum coccineum]
MDPVEIHHIKQREGESTKDFVQRFKTESRHVKGAPECMRISGFMHGITNYELIKRLHENIPKSVNEIMRVTTTFLRREVAASNQARKRHFQMETARTWEKAKLRQKGGFSKPPKHLIKEIKQGGRKDQPKAAKKGETPDKDKTMAILMVQPWQKIAKQRITQSFSSDPEISFLPLGEEDGLEGPMIIEAEIGGHFIHCMYVDGGSSLKILYEHCFKRLRLEVKNQMVPATTPLIGFSGEVIWPMGQISLPVKIGDAEHSTSTWMNFVVVRRSTHSTEQQDNPAGMRDGLQTRSIVFQCRSDHGRKNQNSYSSGILRANNYDRLNSNRGGTEGIVTYSGTASIYSRRS